MKKTDTTPAVPAPKATPNPGQIFEEPAEKQSTTVAAPDESAEVPAQPES